MATKPKSRTKRARESQAPAPADNPKAREQLRRTAAEWCSPIRRRLTDLADEVSRVHAAAKDGSPLAAVLDVGALSEVMCDLSAADCAAGNLGLAEDDPPIPDLYGLAKALGEKL